MLWRFCAYGFLKNQRYYEPFWMLILLAKGLTFFEIGLLVACREGTTNLLEVASGALADVWGRRRSMLLSLIGYQLSFVLLYLGDHVALLALGMVVYGVADAFRSGTHKAMILTWLRLQGREKERTAVYGVTRSWSKYGSAAGVLVGTVWVLVTGDLEGLFLLALVPYGLGLANMLSYPGELDGEQATGRLELRGMVRHLVETAKSIWRSRPLKGLLAESAGFNGTFDAVKDYLQPVLVATAGAGLGAMGLLEAQGLDGERRGTLLLGVVYVALYLWSATLSKRASKLAARAGGEDQASRWIWWGFVGVFGLVGLGSWAGWGVPIILGFVVLHALESVWSPLILSRFDAHGEEAQGATLLSVASQAESLATLALAPALGWAVDQATAAGQGMPWWPLAAWGVGLGLVLALRVGRVKRGA